MSNKMRLGDLVRFSQGLNPSRLSEKETLLYYDQSAFDLDYKNLAFEAGLNTKHGDTKAHLLRGEIIISNSLSLAAIVSKANEGKVASLNFTRVEINREALDKGYFLFLFNAYPEVKRQKEKNMQGSNIQKLSIKSLSDLEIPLIALALQQRIGEIYLETMTLKRNLERQATLVDKLVQARLIKKIKEQSYE